MLIQVIPFIGLLTVDQKDRLKMSDLKNSKWIGNSVSKHTPIVVFNNRLLRNWFLYFYVGVRFHGNQFAVPLPSSELLRLSGVMLQYSFNVCIQFYRFWAHWAEEKVTPPEYQRGSEIPDNYVP
jgi:hypothetical protein